MMMRTALPIYKILILLIFLCASAGAGGCAPATHRTLGFTSGAPLELDAPPPENDLPASPAPPLTLPPHAAGWEITGHALCDVTGDGRADLVLVVWRPWRDWPIMRWREGQSPIASFRDENGMSCHLIVLEPETGDEIWAGSALPFPILDMAAGDLDGDGVCEVATIRGEYTEEWRGVRRGRSCFVDIWGWEGMGFVMKWGPIPGRFTHLAIADRDNDGVGDLILL